jgi:hypothetical protein
VTDPSAIPFAFPDVAGRRLLLLGLGGGCDAITAFAMSRLFGRGAKSAVYANTKTAEVGAVEPITPHVLRVSGPLLDRDRIVPRRGQAWIDHSVPRDPDSGPWIVLLNEGEDEIAGELRSFGFDLVIGVDTGGDSIAHKAGRGRRGRDQRMLAVLMRTGLPLLHVVVAPGADGEASFADLHDSMAERAADGRYRGCFTLDPLFDVFRAFSGSLGPTRTPQIILATAEGRLASADGLVTVPRGKRPRVPKSWLTTAFVFAPLAGGAT